MTDLPQPDYDEAIDVVVENLAVHFPSIDQAEIRGLVGQLLRECAAVPQVGAVQHSHFRTCGHYRPRPGGDVRHHGAGRGALLRCAPLQSEAEPCRFAQQVAVRAQLIVLDVEESVAMHQGGQRHRGLVQRELAPDAGALAIAERLVGVRRP